MGDNYYLPELETDKHVTKSVHTESIDNVYDHIVSDGAELANALQALSDGQDVSIRLGRETSYDLAGNISLPIDISGTSPTIHGPFPKVNDVDVNPDQKFSPESGAVINLGGNSFLTGNDVRGADIQNLFLTNPDTSNSSIGFDFGETDRLGCYMSTFKHIYGHNVGEALFKFTNIQHVYGEHLKAIDSLRVLHIINDHSNHAGANSVFVDPYIHAATDSNNDFPEGGYLLEAKQNSLNHAVFIRPQANFVDGNAGTGTNFRAKGNDSAVVSSMSILGGNWEGSTNIGFHGSRIATADVRMVGSQASSYDVLIDDGPTGSSSIRNIVMNRTTSSGAPCKVTDERNYLYGVVNGVEGPWSGDVYDLSTGRSKNLAPDRLWQADTAPAPITNTFESLDGYRQQTSNSGSISQYFDSVHIGTGSTADSSAKLRKDLKYGGVGDISSQRDTAFAVVANFDATNEELFVVTGDLEVADKTSPHVGFGMVNGDLIGSTSNGTTQNTTTLISGASTGTYRLRAVVNSQNNVEYYVDGSLKGTASSDVFSGSSVLFVGLATNPNGSSAKIRLSEYRHSQTQ